MSYQGRSEKARGILLVWALAVVVLLPLLGGTAFAADDYFPSARWPTVGTEGYSALASPEGIAVQPNGAGDVFVADTLNARVVRYSNRGRYLRSYGEATSSAPLSYPMGVAVDRSGNLYVADPSLSKVMEYDASGNYLREFGHADSGSWLQPGDMEVPWGMSVDSTAGLLWVADYSTQRIQIFDVTANRIDYPHGRCVGAWTDSSFAGPSAVALDNRGSAWVSDCVLNNVFKCAINASDPSNITASVVSSSAVTDFVNPIGISYSSRDSLFVADWQNSRIVKVNALTGRQDGNSLDGTGDWKLKCPEGVAVDATDSVFVIDTQNNRVVKFVNQWADDVDPPVTASNIPDHWVQGPFNVILTSQDAQSGLAGILYGINVPSATTSYTAPFSVPTEGTSTITFRGVDNRGNVEDQQALRLRIDNSPPNSTCTAASGWTNSTAPISLTASDTYSGVRGILYKVGASAVATYTGTAITSIPQNDSTQLQYWAVDNAGNVETPHTTLVQIDTVPPVTTSDALASTYKAAATIHLNPTDNKSGVAATFYSLDGSFPTIPYTGSITVSSEGTTTLRYYSVDNAGNAESPTMQQIAIDSVPPTTRSSIDPQKWYKSDVQVSLTATDTYGVASTWYRILPGPPQSYSGTFTVPGEGLITVEFGSVDFQNNREATQSATVQIDRTPPSTTDNTDSQWHPAFPVSLTSIDPGGSGVDHITYIIEGEQPTTWTGGAFVVSGNGGKKVWYSATDRAGNTEATKTATVLCDGIAPTSSCDATVTMRFAHISATDTVSGVANIYYSTDGSYPTLVYDPASGIDTSGGVQTIRWYAEDAAGNKEQPPHSLLLISDHQPPMTTSNIGSSWHPSPFHVQLTAVDPGGSGVKSTSYRLNNGADTAYTSDGFDITQQGATTVTYSSVDQVGNVEASKTETAWVDGTKPVTTSDVQSTYGNNATITLSPSDAYSGVASTQWSVDGGQWAAGTIVSVPTLGTHTLRYFSTDRASNVESITTTTFLILPRVEQTDPHMLFRGTWGTGSSAAHSGGSWKYTSTAGAWSYVAFDGTRIDLIGAKGPNYGQACVRIDGGSPTTVDYYNPSVVLYQQRLASFTGLANTRHVLSVEYLSSHNASATSPFFIGVDAVDISGAIATDTAPPATTVSATGAWRSTPETVTLTATDPYTWVTTTRYVIDGGPLCTYAGGFPVSGEGVHTVDYSSVNGAGVTESTQTVLVRIDATPPNTTDDAPAGWRRGPDTVHLTPTDGLSGVASTFYSLDGTNPTLQLPGAITVSAEGTTTLKYYSRDAAGNNESVRSSSVRIDNTPPTASDDATTSWVTSPAVVHVSGTDAYSGVATTTYSLDGGASQVYSGAVSISADGTHTLAYTIADAVNNTSVLRTANVRVDGTAPVTTATVAPSYLGTATISLTASDALSGVQKTEWRLDGGTWTTGTSVTVTQGGTHVLDMRSTDWAGNRELYKSVSFDVAVRYEQTEPLFDFEGTWGTALGAHSGGSYLYSITPSSAVNVAFQGKRIVWRTLLGPSNGIARLTLDGGTPVDVDLWAATNQYNQPVWSSGDLPQGRHTLRIECTGAKNATSGGKFIGVDAFDITGAPSLRRYEQTDPLMNFAGSWTNLTDSNLSSASYKYTITSGAALNVAFTGTRFDWVSTKGPANGIARVTLDGGAPVDVDLYNPTVQYQQVVWTTGTITKGFHTLRIEYTGAKNVNSTNKFIGVDALDVIGLLNQRRYEQTDPSLTFAGSWNTGLDSNMSAGSYKYTNSPQSSFNVSFSGTRVDWITSVSSVNGIARVILDGTNTQTVDLYASTYATKRVVWSSGTIPDGPHTLRIEYTGTKNPASTGTYVGLDAIDVVGITTLRRYDDSDTNLAYEGSWTKYTDANMSGGGYVYAADADVAVNVAFSGTRVDYITSVGTGNGKVLVTLDGTQTTLVDLYSPTFMYKQVVWSSGTLADGTHTLRIESAGNKKNTFVGIDGLDLWGVLTQASTGPLPVTLEENDARVSLTGTWTAGTDAKMSGGQYAYSVGASATASVSFTGTRLDWSGPKGSSYGIALVSVDGGAAVPVDLFSATYAPSAVVWTTGDLPAKSHTVTITTTGTKDAQSSGTYVAIDSFVVKGTVP